MCGYKGLYLFRFQASLTLVPSGLQRKDHLAHAPPVAVVQEVTAAVKGHLLQGHRVHDLVVLPQEPDALLPEVLRVQVAGDLQRPATRELRPALDLGLPGLVDGRGVLADDGVVVLGESADGAADAGVLDDLGGGLLAREALEDDDLLDGGEVGVGEFPPGGLDPLDGDDAGELEEGLLFQFWRHTSELGLSNAVTLMAYKLSKNRLLPLNSTPAQSCPLWLHQGSVFHWL